MIYILFELYHLGYIWVIFCITWVIFFKSNCCLKSKEFSK